MLDRLMDEWGQLRPGSDDPELDAVRLAILVEDVLGITLTDEQISLDFLLNPQALASLRAGPAAHV